MVVEGIDISYIQGNIDYEQIDKNEVNFVMMRIGYRGYGNGQIVEDKFFVRNLKGCLMYNIPFGIYFFSQAKNEQEGREEAKWIIDKIKSYKIQYPIVIDTEESGHINGNGRADNISPADRTMAVIGFCDELERNNYYAAIYCSESWYKNKLLPYKLLAYDVWVANWNKKPAGTYYGMWQYSSKGRRKGISVDVDLNRAYKDYPSLMETYSLNNYGGNITTYDVKVFGLNEYQFNEVIEFLKSKGISHESKVSNNGIE